MITLSSQFGNLNASPSLESLPGFSLKIDLTLKISCSKGIGPFRGPISVFYVTLTLQKQENISSSLAHMPKPAGIKFKLHGTTTFLSKTE
jgi:hypothetical protein